MQKFNFSLVPLQEWPVPLSSAQRAGNAGLEREPFVFLEIRADWDAMRNPNRHACCKSLLGRKVPRIAKTGLAGT
jgi:hypothetical protein